MILRTTIVDNTYWYTVYDQNDKLVIRTTCEWIAKGFCK